MAPTVIFIDHYAGSERHGMEFRPYYLSREWARKGIRVIVIAASYSHLRTMNPVVKDRVECEQIDGISYVWLRTPSYGGNGVGRVINMAFFIYRLLRIRHRISCERDICAVIASSTYPLDIFPAWMFARKAGARLIFEVHDLWPLSPLELGGFSRIHPFIILMQLAENFAYKTADIVVSILPKTISHMLRHGMAVGKFRHIPNGIDLDRHKEFAALAAETSALIPPDKFVVGYAGSVGPANCMHSFVESAALVRMHTKIHFICVGSGSSLAEIKAMARRLQLRNITFIPPIPKSQIPALLGRFDICYVGMKAQSLYRFGISPNKVFDYMLAARPLLLAVKAGNDFAEEAKCGLSIEPENPRAISEAILAFFRMDPGSRNVLGQNGREFVLRKHTYARLAADFAMLFREQGG